MIVRQTLRNFEINFAKYKIYYDIFMSVLSIGYVISFVMQSKVDFSEPEASILNEVDFSVWVFFVIDYFARLIVAENRMHFIQHNIIDLIAIIPFDTFQCFRAIRLAKLAYMIRGFIYLNRVYNRISRILTTNNFHHILWFTFSVIFLGALAISYIDDMEIGDALWLSFVTTTTVGYGDIAPQSFGGRMIAAVLMLIGIGFLSTLTGAISTFFISSNEKSSYKNETIDQAISKLKDFQNLTVDDLNDMHKVLVALKESKK